MQSIEIRGNLLYYYGNMAGHVDGGRATIDAMFENDELSEWLSGRDMKASYREGVFDQLILSGPESHNLRSWDNASPAQQEPDSAKRVRIWQLKPESDFTIRFRDYDELSRPPDQNDYRAVFDGEIDTDDLDDIYDKFSEAPPLDFSGNPVSISDVIELYDSSGSEFHYVGRNEFIEVDFESVPQEQMQEINIQ